MRNLYCWIREEHELNNDKWQTHDIDELNEHKIIENMLSVLFQLATCDFQKIPYCSTSLSVSNCRQLTRRTVHMYQLSLHMGPPFEATGPFIKGLHETRRKGLLWLHLMFVETHLFISLSFYPQPPNIPNVESPHIGPINTTPVFLRGCLILFNTF